MTPRSETRSTKAIPQRTRTSQVIPFRKVLRNSGRTVAREAGWRVRKEGEQGEHGDWSLVVFFLTIGFIIAARRVAVAVKAHEVFGVDASLAFVFVLGVPVLLREPLSRFLGQLVLRVRAARR